MDSIKKLDYISIIQYKTLEMIEIANKQKSLFFEIFKILDTEEFQDWRIAIVVEKNVYLKSANETNIYVYPYGKLIDMHQYIIVLKDKNSNENFKLTKRIIKILDEFKVSFEEVNKYLLDESFFELLIVDKVLETNNLF
ncbi:hypothetical protein [Enterococcus lemanii]|jgi:hypothetical protein|uniref:Uncharacterized protein n=1 Tax=Enterococcus lemanii TaxID=1159752 RepID=A0ABV9MVC8_9ENTE|nr:hypothetical protein [Enterococcus lemanii]MBM7710269.1 hypothetical protein [Enterococcus lemanii]